MPKFSLKTLPKELSTQVFDRTSFHDALTLFRTVKLAHQNYLKKGLFPPRIAEITMKINPNKDGYFVDVKIVWPKGESYELGLCENGFDAQRLRDRLEGWKLRESKKFENHLRFPLFILSTIRSCQSLSIVRGIYTSIEDIPATFSDLFKRRKFFSRIGIVSRMRVISDGFIDVFDHFCPMVSDKLKLFGGSVEKNRKIFEKPQLNGCKIYEFLNWEPDFQILSQTSANFYQFHYGEKGKMLESMRVLIRQHATISADLLMLKYRLNRNCVEMIDENLHEILGAMPNDEEFECICWNGEPGSLDEVEFLDLCFYEKDEPKLKEFWEFERILSTFQKKVQTRAIGYFVRKSGDLEVMMRSVEGMKRRLVGWREIDEEIVEIQVILRKRWPLK
ncbi:unnamed protein product, partial [Mesorhabditis belari]|uniref:F-box domain-containing protein n=1 Tax=Mesorhabditis belari TaxID=2138241 RepID=A0AAF3JB62_9BILA